MRVKLEINPRMFLNMPELGIKWRIKITWFAHHKTECLMKIGPAVQKPYVTNNLSLRALYSLIKSHRHKIYRVSNVSKCLTRFLLIAYVGLNMSAKLIYCDKGTFTLDLEWLHTRLVVVTKWRNVFMEKKVFDLG